MRSILKINTIQIIAVCVLLGLVNFNCKKLVEVDAPITSINGGNVYDNDATAAAVLTGIYTRISDQNISLISLGNISGLSLYPELSADELTLFNLSNSNLLPYYKNDLTATTTSGIFWTSFYSNIFVINSAIEGLTSAKALTSVVKQQLLGEAKFLRAFYYFYLVNLYGDVPLVINSDYRVNATIERTSKSQVYQQIITDLKESQALLSADYLDGTVSATTSERVRPTKWVAAALLARVYMYTNDWVKAEEQASQVINNTGQFNLVPLNNVFLKNSNEAIWQLQPVRTGVQSNTGEGTLFVLPATGPNTGNYPVYLSNNVVNSFEAGDNRKSNWTGNVIVSGNTYNYPYKYKIGAVNTTTKEYIMVFRLGEQFLIRAEARAQQNNISGAQSDLNSIRSRAGLANTTATDKNSLLIAILHERQVELFTEWGHRWFDLKRTGNIDAVMSTVTPQKAAGSVWKSYQQLYPIPQSELNLNPGLTQNVGY